MPGQPGVPTGPVRHTHVGDGMGEMRPDPAEPITVITPSPRLKTIYHLSLLLFVWVGLLSWFIPLSIFMNPGQVLMVSSLFLAAVIFLLVYIRLYYRSIHYVLTNDEITRKRGVWFTRTDTVPYGRITGITLRQGPLSRRFGLWTVELAIMGSPGLAISGITDAEALREYLMTRVNAARVR